MELTGHAFLIRGDSSATDAVMTHLEEEGIAARGSTDTYMRVFQSFGIDDAHALRERAALGALADERRVFLIATPSMTQEAQNALLKTLEEPPADALFFFVVPAPELLLPTLRSRMQVLDIDLEHPDSIISPQEFLRATPPVRLEMLKPLLDKGEDEKRDMGAILTFLSSLERTLEKHPGGLSAVYRARKYAGDRGALLKPLLEQLALLVPEVG